MNRDPLHYRVAGIDPRSLAVFRIGLGALLLGDCLIRIPYFQALQTDAGVFPRLLAPSARWTPLTLHFLDGGTALAVTLALVAALCALLLTLGYATRLVTIVSWLLLGSLHSRNPLVLSYGDHVLRLLLFWSIFLPLGRRFSLDARRASPTSPPTPVFSAASVALLCQVLFVYTFTGLLKSADAWGLGGHAIYYAMSQDGWVRPLGELLRSQPDYLYWLNPAVRWMEIAAPFALFAPWPLARTLAVSGFLLFQLMLGSTFILNIFPFVNAVALLPFLPPWFWDRVGLGGTSPGGSHTPVVRRGVAAWAAEGAVALLLLYAFCFNLAGIGVGPGIPAGVRKLASPLGLDQNWGMYSPGVDPFAVRHVVVASLEGGARIDLARGGTPVEWAQPEKTGAEYHPARWAQYIEALRKYPEPVQRRFVAWYCQRWNADHHGEERAATVALWFVKIPSPPPGETAAPQSRRLLVEHHCRAAEKARAARAIGLRRGSLGSAQRPRSLRAGVPGLPRHSSPH